MHPTEYLVPMIHQKNRDVARKLFPEAQPTIEQTETPQHDPFYSNAGVLLYLHYLKNFPKKMGGGIHVRSSLMYNNNLAKDDYKSECYWMSEQVPMNQNLEQIPANMFKIQDVVKLENINRSDMVMPLVQANTWYRDFYKMLWENSLQHDLYLILEIVENNSTYPIGI